MKIWNQEYTHTLSKLNSLGQEQKSKKMKTSKAHNLFWLVGQSLYTHAKSNCLVPNEPREDAACGNEMCNPG